MIDSMKDVTYDLHCNCFHMIGRMLVSLVYITLKVEEIRRLTFESCFLQ